MRTCPECTRSLPIDQFGKNRSRKDGLQTYCKKCHADRQRAWRTENPEYLAEWRASHPGYQAAYKAANPRYVWEAAYRARMKRMGHPVETVDPVTRDEVITEYGDKCWHCGGPFQELDHYPIPVSHAGPHTLSNVKPACTPCNRKSWKDYDPSQNVTPGTV